ncbi:MAG: PEP-CTERM sorting domain-containing protein [Leptolyngbyaceae cyanobacterium SL_7_1]|nr:PEP-CTERM sorting domain-containing protein [Leptolyngbyaceae cyanobacterium SL_7_1]
MRRWQPIAITIKPLTVAGMLLLAAPTQAGTLSNDWTYAIDSFTDGTEGSIVGETSAFEFYALAFKQTSDRLFFAISSNLPLDGYPNPSARNGAVNYSDLFLNFTTPEFASANGNLVGIRFDSKNDTTLGLGVYNNVTAISLSSENTGYSSLADYNTQVALSGGTVGYADGTAAYFDSTQPAYTTIATGNFIGEVTPEFNLAELGLDFGAVGAVGSQIFGFSVAKNIFPSGGFIANVLLNAATMA